MRASKNKLIATAGILSAGGLSLGLIGSGVGANFVKSLTGNNANIKVAAFDCRLTNPSDSPNVILSNSDQTVTINLPDITSSAPGSSTLPVGVQNTGGMPIYVNWESTTSGDLFNSGVVSAHQPAEGVGLPVNGIHSYDLGFDWGALSNADLNTSGTVSYTVNCTDSRSDLTLFQQNGGIASWNPNGKAVELTMAATPQSGAAAGIQVQGQASTLPVTEPTFTTDNYNAGSPRWYIQFANGDYVFGYPVNSGLVVNWEEHGSTAPHPGSVSWSTVRGDFSSATISSINILMDGDQTGVTDTISQIQYNGHELLKS